MMDKIQSDNKAKNPISDILDSHPEYQIKEHQSLEDESLASGYRKGVEQEAEDWDGTLRGYRSDDETIGRGYYTSTKDSASTSTPNVGHGGEKYDEDGADAGEASLALDDFQMLKERSKSPGTLEKEREFAWRQFIAREKQKEELYKKFEAGKVNAEFIEGASRKLPISSFPLPIPSSKAGKETQEGAPLLSKTKPQGNAANTRPIPSLAEIESMITSVKDMNEKTVRCYPPPQPEVNIDVMKYSRNKSNPPKTSIAKYSPSVPATLKLRPVPSFPRPPTYSVLPTLPLPSQVPSYPTRPLTLAPPPPGFNFPPPVATLAPPSNIYFPAPPSSFPIPILSRPPPTLDINANIYPQITPPPSGERNYRTSQHSSISQSSGSKTERRQKNESSSRSRSISCGRSNSCDRGNSFRGTRRSRSKNREKVRKSPRRSKQNKESCRSSSRIKMGSKPTSCTLSPESDIEPGRGSKGTLAMIKEYIDDKTGILEVVKGPGQQGPIVLFHINQLWIMDKKLDPHGDPVHYDGFKEQCNLGVKDLVPVGQLVRANTRNVRSQFVDFQATVIWPRYTQQPPYTVKPADLNDQLTAFHASTKLETFLPLCIGGLPPQDASNTVTAVVTEIIDHNWGTIEVCSTCKEENEELTKIKKFSCLFHKTDVWMDDGLHVAQHDFFVDKPLADMVAVKEHVNLTARSIGKGLLIDDLSETGLQMQALCVSLKQDLIPSGAGTGTKLLGGPGTIGEFNNGQTPYMFETGLTKKLNKKLGKFLEETGRKYESIDGKFIEIKVKKEIIEIVENNKYVVDGNKMIHKITDFEEKERNVLSRKWKNHLEGNEGLVIRILDDNFGIIQHEGLNILFDTCDLWISSQFTAAKKQQKLHSVIKVGVKVVFHAALIEKSAQIPYIASAVWPQEATFFKDSSKYPTAIKKESIHSDKIKIYKMVSETIKEPLPDITSVKKIKKVEEKDVSSWPHGLGDKTPQHVTQHVHAVEGIVKIGFKLKNKPELFCGIVEFIGQDPKNEESTAKVHYAFFLSKYALEDHEKDHISLPKTRVLFNASQFSDLLPVSYLITTISNIHTSLPHEVISRTTETIQEVKRCLIKILAQDLPEISKIELAPYKIIALENETMEELVGPSVVQDSLIDCRDGCRLVCLLNKDSGVLEDSNRNLCYFERSDLNLETDLGLHDLVVLFTRINLIRIRFQATEVEEVARLGPIKLVAHDGSVKISGVIEDRLPNVKRCSSGYGKNNQERFSNDKVARAKEAAIMFKMGKYLKPQFILDSPDFKPQFDVGKKKDEGRSRKRKLILGGENSQKCLKGTEIRRTSRSEERGKYRPRSKDRFSKSPQRILRTSKKDGTFETRAHPRKSESLSFRENSVKRNPSRRHSSDQKSNKRKKMPISFEESSQKRQTTESLSCCKILERYKGKVRSILNENFGLIEFYLDLKYPSFCLFDTFDLFVEDEETAAEGKLTVGNVVSLDMEVSFNACELQPGKSVAWLATGVWRTDGSVQKFPPVVEPQNIQNGKVEVYKKVAETCQVLVFDLLKPVGATDTADKDEEVVLERRATDLLQLEKRKRARSKRPRNDQVETNPKFLEERRRDIEAVKELKSYRAYSRECPRDKRESRDPFTPDRFMIQSKTNWEESAREWKLEIHAWYREQSREYNQNRKRHFRNADGEAKRKRRRSRSPHKSGHLPSKIYDHVTSGTLDHIVSDLYAVICLNEPPGAKAILHYDRVWVDDHQIFGGWRILNYGWFQDLRINARRIHVDNLDIDYQVTFAHVGIRSYDPKRGVYNYTGRMDKFVEEKINTSEMDRELDKCLDIIKQSTSKF